MTTADTLLTLDDLALVPWQGDIAAVPEQECWHYCNRFCAKASEAEGVGDGKTRAVYAFLARVTSLVFKLDLLATPLWPPEQLDRFTEHELVLLAALAPTVGDPEKQARVADILWLRNYGARPARDYATGRLAVTAYLASARRVENPEY